MARHVGHAWVADSPEEALASAPEVPPSQVLKYMGTHIYLQGTPTAPRNLPEIPAAIWKQLHPQRLFPDAAMMVLMAKLPSKLLPLASVYRPTAQVHAANNTLMVRGCKHMTGNAHTDTVVGRGCPGVGLAGCVGEGSVPRVASLHPPDSSGASGSLPGLCLPRGNTPTICGAPTSSARCGRWWTR